MKVYFAILLASIATTHQRTEVSAFSISSRKAFLTKAATTSAAIIATTPTIASAREGAFQRAVKEKKTAKEKYGKLLLMCAHLVYLLCIIWFVVADTKILLQHTKTYCNICKKDQSPLINRRLGVRQEVTS